MLIFFILYDIRFELINFNLCYIFFCFYMEDYVKYKAKLKASRTRTLNAVKKRLQLTKTVDKNKKNKVRRAPRVTTKKNDKIALIKAKLQFYNETKDLHDDNEKESVMVSIAEEIQNLHRKSVRVHKKKSTDDEDDLDSNAIVKNKLAYDNAIKKINNLKNHPNNDKISFVGDRFMLNIPGTTSVSFNGIHGVLHDVFFPKEEEDPFKKDPEEVKRRRQKKNYQPGNLQKKTSNNKKETSTLMCKLHGKEHGIQVHKEIETFTNIVANESNMDKCVEQIKDPDPCTLKFIYYFMENGWKPVISEYKVWDYDNAIATSIDVILLDIKTWELIIVELKTGYDGESYSSIPTDEKLKKPFEELKMCPKTKHQMQLLFQKMILDKVYKTKVNRCYVLRVSPKINKAESYPLMKWARIKHNQQMFYDRITLYQKNKYNNSS